MTPNSGESPQSDDLRRRVRGYEDRVLRVLKRNGCRITGPRVEVARRLAEVESPVTAYELHALINKAGKRIDVVSVYRIIEAFRKYGLVYHVGSLNAFYPVLLDSGSDRLAELVIFEDTKKATELQIPAGILDIIEAQARSLGVAITGIKIELQARDLS